MYNQMKNLDEKTIKQGNLDNYLLNNSIDKMKINNRKLFSTQKCKLNNNNKNKNLLNCYLIISSSSLLLLLLFICIIDNFSNAQSTTDVVDVTPAAESFNSNQNPDSKQSNGDAKVITNVNFTEIEQKFHLPIANDTELLKRWKSLDASIKSGIQVAVKAIFPRLVAMASDARVSGDCSGAMLKWMLSLRGLKTWAIKMLDAIGKPSPGVLEGSLTLFGDYGQCLSIRAPDEDEIEITGEFVEYFRGKYCVLHIKPQLTQKRKFYTVNSTIDILKRSNIKSYDRTLYDDLSELAMAFHYTSIRADLCVPSLCSKDDIQRIATYLGNVMDMRTYATRCEVEPPTGSLPLVLDRTRLIWTFLALFLLAIITLIRLILPKQQKQLNNKQINIKNNETSFPLQDKQTPTSSTTGSMTTTTIKDQQFINDNNKDKQIVDNDDDDLMIPSYTIKRQKQQQQFLRANLNDLKQTKLIISGCLGVTILWFILVHSLVSLPFQFMRHLLPLRDYLFELPALLIVNSTILYDTILILIAFLYAYKHVEHVNQQQQQQQNKKLSKKCQKFLIDTLHIYLRRLIAIILIITFVILISGLAGSIHQSPLWMDLVNPLAQSCLDSGAYNLAFIQNLLPFSVSICLPHTWLFCVELQLFLFLGIPFVYILNNFYYGNVEHDKNINVNENDVNNKNQSIKSSRDSSSSSTNENNNNYGACKARTLSLGIITVGSLASACHVYTYGLPPVFLFTFPDLDDRKLYLWAHAQRSLTHLVPFVLGLRAGHVARRLRLNLLFQQQLNHITNSSTLTSSASTNSLKHRHQEAPLWQTGGPYGRCLLVILSCFTLTFVIFSPFAWHWANIGVENVTVLVSSLYDIITRLVWSISLAWLLVQLITPAPVLRHQHSSLRPIIVNNNNNNKNSNNDDSDDDNNDDDDYNINHPKKLRCWLDKVCVKFLTHPILVTFGRLWAHIYLIYPIVYSLVMGTQQQASFSSPLMLVYVILGNSLITLALAHLLETLIDEPLNRIMCRLRGVSLTGPSHLMYLSRHRSRSANVTPV